MFDLLDSWIVDVAGTGFIGNLFSLSVNLLIILVLTGIIGIIFSIIAHIAYSRSKIATIKSIIGFCIKRRFVKKFTYFTLFFLILTFAFRIPRFEAVIGRLSVLGMVITLMVIIASILDVINDFYSTKEISKSRPIKGPLQIIKIVLFLVLTLICISVLINQNPLVLISGIGAFTAILSLIFKDALVGLVSGIQITSENLLQIGDWIRIPSENVEGTVSDITLLTVRITTFNNTVVSVPTYTFLNHSFANWHDTISEEKRQVYRTVYVDANSVKFDADGTSTNLASYREAIMKKMEESPNFKKGYTALCRTMTSTDGLGIPVEIIFTTTIVDYDEYCAFCSYVSETAYAELNKFGLKPYQPASQLKL